jgi:hypothetical protein
VERIAGCRCGACIRGQSPSVETTVTNLRRRDLDGRQLAWSSIGFALAADVDERHLRMRDPALVV